MNRRGIGSVNYKNGTGISVTGYLTVWTGKTSVRGHRIIMEQALGRELLPSEVVHHINGDKLDNDISNLLVMTDSERRSLHGRKLSEQDVLEIVYLYCEGYSQRFISRIFGISHSHIGNIVRGDTGWGF
jgi:hypothetical protein